MVDRDMVTNMGEVKTLKFVVDPLVLVHCKGDPMQYLMSALRERARDMLESEWAVGLWRPVAITVEIGPFKIERNKDEPHRA